MISTILLHTSSALNCVLFLVLPFHVAKVQSSSTRLGAATQKTNGSVVTAYPLCFCRCSASLRTHKSLNELIKTLLSESRKMLVLRVFLKEARHTEKLSSAI